MFQWLLSCNFENVNLFLWPCLFVPLTVFHTHVEVSRFLAHSFVKVWLHINMYILIHVHFDELSN